MSTQRPFSDLSQTEIEELVEKYVKKYANDKPTQVQEFDTFPTSVKVAMVVLLCVLYHFVCGC